MRSEQHPADLGQFGAAIFDLDGVVTRTAKVHLAAWTQLIDGYLQYRGHWLHVDLRSDEVTLSAPHGWGGPRRIEVRGKVHSFGPGEALSFTCQLDEGWRPRSEAPRRTEHGVSSGAAELQQRAGGAK